MRPALALIREAKLAFTSHLSLSKQCLSLSINSGRGRKLVAEVPIFPPRLKQKRLNWSKSALRGPGKSENPGTEVVGTRSRLHFGQLRSSVKSVRATVTLFSTW